MKNYEKYANEIKEYDNKTFCSNFVKGKILKRDICGDMGCEQCALIQMLWLLEEYEEPEEPEVDWNTVEVDTPILVRNRDDEPWHKRYFAEYENGTVYAWVNGTTSWSGEATTNWKYAKLAEVEDEKDNT